METPQSPMSPPAQHPKKGLGTGAKIGIGCGAIVLLAIIGFVIVAVMFGGKMKEFVDEAQKNPTRATATMMVKASGGAMELVAEDDENKRYTVKEVKTGTLTTIYWDAKKNAPVSVPGDFSAIPTESPAPPETLGEPATEPEQN